MNYWKKIDINKALSKDDQLKQKVFKEYYYPENELITKDMKKIPIDEYVYQAIFNIARFFGYMLAIIGPPISWFICSKINHPLVGIGFMFACIGIGILIVKYTKSFYYKGKLIEKRQIIIEK